MAHYDPRDRFFLQAKKDGYRARSAYKLDEIQKRFRLMRSGDRILDLGAAPGGFCQIAAQAVGPNGYVLGVDLEAIPTLPAPIETWVADAFTPELLAKLRADGRAPYDAVLSDLAPKTSGVHGVDEARSLGLAERALDLSIQVLKPGGTFVVKLFMGAGFEEFRELCRAGFAQVKVVKPEASVARRSKELYLVCTGSKPRSSVG